MNGPVAPDYEWIERRSPSYLAQYGHRIAIGENIAVGAVNCYQCHWHGGEPPEQLATRFSKLILRERKAVFR